VLDLCALGLNFVLPYLVSVLFMYAYAKVSAQPSPLPFAVRLVACLLSLVCYLPKPKQPKQPPPLLIVLMSLIVLQRVYFASLIISLEALEWNILP
jgi:hypothetical protein